MPPPPFPLGQGVTFGLGKQELIYVLGVRPDIDAEGFLYYEHTFAPDIQGYLVYTFEQDRLYGAGYIVTEVGDPAADFLTTYRRFQQGLVDRHGRADADENVWQEGRVIERDPSRYGAAILTGALQCISVWVPDDFVLVLHLSGGYDMANLALLYIEPGAPVLREFGAILGI